MGKISFEPFQEQLKKSRLTKYTLTHYFNISKSTLTRISRGNDSPGGVELTLYTVARLCGALGCQPGDIMKYIPDAEDERYAQLRREAINKRSHWTGEEIAAEPTAYRESRAEDRGSLLRDSGTPDLSQPKRRTEPKEEPEQEENISADRNEEFKSEF